MPSFQKSLIVEQFQGNYLKRVFTNMWFSRYVIAAILVDGNKRSFISPFFCPPAMRYFHIPIMQYVLGVTSHLLVGWFYASVNWISIVLMQTVSQNELYYGVSSNSE